MSGRSRYTPPDPREPLERKLYGDERDLFRERDLSDAMQRYLAQGGRLLQHRIPGSHYVRNVNTGNVLLCCLGPCDKPGDSRITIEVPHDTPRWNGEKLIYIFCSDAHRREYGATTRLARHL